MPVGRCKRRAKDAIQSGNYVEAAAFLSELAQLSPEEPDYLRMAADVSRQAGLDEQASGYYLKLAHHYAARQDVGAVRNALKNYEELCPDCADVRQKMYRFCRSRGVSQKDAMVLLSVQDRAVFALREHPVFSQLDQAVFDSLLTSLQRQHFQDGEVVVRKGERADALFIVARGGLRPVVEDNDGEVHHMAVAGPGEFSGETPFLTHQPERTADLYAVNDTVVYRIPYQTMEQLIAKVPDLRQWLERLHRSHVPERQLAKTPFFARYDDRGRLKLATQMEVMSIAGGATLFSYGDTSPLDIYVVVSGWFSVNIPAHGGEKYLYTARTGQLLGELGLLENSRKYTVRAISDGQLLRWPEEACRDYFLRHESFRHQLADRLLHLKQRVSNAS